jgi:hypothetical protein
MPFSNQISRPKLTRFFTVSICMGDLLSDTTEDFRAEIIKMFYIIFKM